MAEPIRSTVPVVPAPAIYLPFAQVPMSEVTVFARTAGAPAAIAGDLRQLLRTFGPDIAAFNIRTMDEIRSSSSAVG